MIKPTPKAPFIDELLTSFTGKSRITSIQNHQCMTCNKPVNQFRDQLSLKEYTISGMCQACQDEVFDTDYGKGDEPIDI